jgi:hypothetical protein
LGGLRPEPAICGKCFERGFTGFLARAGLPPDSIDLYLPEILDALERGTPPPLAGAGAWRRLRQASGIPDIFGNEKRFFTESLLESLPDLREVLRGTPRPVMGALSAATWCNLLDSAQGHSLPDPSILAGMFQNALAVDEREAFLRALSVSSTLLILGDNAGETVMDRLFIEHSGFTGEVFYMVRPLPVMNDATLTDAVMAGLDHCSLILDSGSDVPSIVPELMSREAAGVFRTCDLVLAKGQGNLEGLWGARDPRLFHSFVVKCPVVARATGLPEGSGVFVSSMRLEDKKCPYTNTSASRATPSTSS